MIFKKIRWRNAFSYGNSWSEVLFDRSLVTCIVGKNGSGKSAIAEVLHIGLFGKSIRKIKKTQWVNNKNNKGLEIEIEIVKGNDEWKIVRKVKPDELSIYKNGVALETESTQREQQNIINRDILGADWIGWQITTSISKSGIQMFMSLDSTERRRFIDNMLGTSVFTEMLKYHKLNIDRLKEDLYCLETEMAKHTATCEAKKEQIEFISHENEKGKALYEKTNIEKINSVKKKIQDLEETLKTKEKPDITQYEETIKLLKANLKTRECDKDEAQKNSTIKFLQESLKTLKDNIPNIPDEKIYQELQETEKSTNRKIAKISAEIDHLKNSIEKLKEGECPTCHTIVTPEHIINEKKIIQDKIENSKILIEHHETEKTQIEQKIQNFINDEKFYKDHIKKIQDTENSIAQEKSNIEKTLLKIENEINTINAKIIQEKSNIENANIIHEKEIDHLKSNIENLKEELARVTEEAQKPFVPIPSKEHRQALAESIDALVSSREKYNKASEMMNYYKIVSLMLKDGGIKTVVINRFLPIINRIVNEKLSALGFFARFRLDENFDETIVYNGKEMQFAQFSEGERLRMNIALILAWREIAKMQGKMHSNLLFLDEIIGESMDSDGYDAFIEILKVLEGMNVFIVTHTPEKIETFCDGRISVKKENGFSHLTQS